MADAHSASAAQIALAWVLHSPAVVAIPGASSVEQLESNVAAAEITLADDEYLALRQAAVRLGGDPACHRRQTAIRRIGTISDLRGETFA